MKIRIRMGVKPKWALNIENKKPITCKVILVSVALSIQICFSLDMVLLKRSLLGVPSIHDTMTSVRFSID